MEIYSREVYIKSLTNKAQEVTNKINLKSGVSKFERFFRRGKIHSNLFSFIQRANLILEQVFPDRFDIQIEVEATFEPHRNTYGSNHASKDYEIFNGFKIKGIGIIIYYPAITITNSRKQSLNITDLYVKIPVATSNHSPYELIFDRLHGVRTSLTVAEFISNYRHSHLGRRGSDSRPYTTYGKFCMGESDCALTINLLQSGFDWDIFELLLEQIETYISWESLEGGPYIQMGEIGSKETEFDKHITLDTLNDLYTSLTRKITTTNPLNVNWKFERGKYVIVDDEKFEKWLLALFTANYRDYKKYTVFKDEKGEYYKEVQGASNLIKQYDDWLPFRGEKKFFKVSGNIRSVKTEEDYYIIPKIKLYVKSRLEYKANYHAVRKTGSTKSSTGIHS